MRVGCQPTKLEPHTEDVEKKLYIKNYVIFFLPPNLYIEHYKASYLPRNLQTNPNITIHYTYYEI